MWERKPWTHQGMIARDRSDAITRESVGKHGPLLFIDSLGVKGSGAEDAVAGTFSHSLLKENMGNY